MASEIETSKLLQDLPNRILCVSAEERKELFQRLSASLSSSDVNAVTIRSVCKILAITLTKYKDNDSQLLVRNIIIELIKNHHDATIESMMAVFKILSCKELANAPPQKASKAALIAFGWTIILNKYGDTESNVFRTELPRLVEYQSLLYQIVLSSLNERLINLANNVLIDILENEYFDKYMTVLIKKEPTSNVIVLMAVLISLKNEKYGVDAMCDYKNNLIDSFVKGIITAKTKPHSSCISACKVLLNNISKVDFEEKILPPMQRSMLRNPETILEAVGLIIRHVNLDFSPYALNLGKMLIQHLYSKDELSRYYSVESLKQLSMKTSDLPVIAELLKEIFSILNGAEGKITVAEYRISLIQGAGNLSFNAISPTLLSNILPLVLELFSKSLNTEVHEKVICFALEMFGLWTMKYADSSDKTVIEIFKKGVGLKTTTPNVRLSYLQWLLACFNKCNLENDSNLTTMLLKIFEKALQNPSQIPLVSEAVCATCLLLKTDGADNDTLNNFWNIILDINKSIFFTERFINSAPTDTLCYIVLMAERILTQHFKSIKGNFDTLVKAFVQAITSTSDKVRSYVNSLLPEIIVSENGIMFSKSIIVELGRKLKLLEVEFDTDEQFLLSKSIEETIRLLCDIKNITTVDAHYLALQLLILCHHPLVVSANPKLWKSILKKQLHLEICQLISLQSEKIKDIIIDNFEINKTYENAIATLSYISPDKFIPLLISKVTSYLSDPLLINVTDDEYFTFLTPEGELYDKSVIPNSNDVYTTAGLKRENKVYSYKEQIEELQLRREIEEKKRKEGKLKPPQLTPKQKEVIKNQTEKELLIKMRLKDLNLKLNYAIKMIESSCIGNSKQCSVHFPVLLTLILEAMKSPLSAELLSQLYYQLRKIWFEESDLGFKLAITTIRMQLPRCDLNKEWMNNDLNNLVHDTLHQLKEIIIEHNDTMTSPAFTYIFEFLKRALISKYVSSKEELMAIGIKIIEQHAQTRGDSINGGLWDYRHPKYLPRMEMFKFLIDLISNHSGRVQTQAVAALLEVAKCSSGEDFCASATQDEINIFLNALENGQEVIRDVALRVLTILSNIICTESKTNANFSIFITRRLWVAKFDTSNVNRNIADDLWKNVKINHPLADDLLCDVIHKEICIQKAAASSLVPLLMDDGSSAKRILKKLLTIYNEKLSMIPPKLDEFDREIAPAIDQWKPRRGIAIAISKISQFFSVDDVNHVMQFMVSAGLGDREEVVHKEMLASALTIVDLHGKDTIITLLPVFEDFLDKAPKSQSYDNIRQAVVILMGSLARHLEKDDKRIEPIVRRLLSALSTPSQQVQEAVANCLPHLMPSVKEEAPAMIKRLLQLLVKSEKYGERRGAAYGIAGIVKGLGILSLKQFDIMSKLTTYIQEKKNYKSREGALFAFEILCTTLGRLFEPYIVHVLPHLLQCFGDPSQYVRQAADDTAKVVMGKLSAHGVKLVLPSLLEALDEDSWRTKTASVELLGAMAYCAPKQLSSCLPSIVPKLIEVLGDSHTKVQEAGADALKVIGSVIKNPEIQAIVPVLLKALEDPSKNTSTCLQSLLQTKFVHFIDAPSLALIMPVVQRAFMDRSTETRKMAAQIIGNMYSLTDQKDLTPYLPNIIPGLKMSLLDPVPEVRAVSARALGAMVRGMGESSFEDLLPWLMQTLTSESSSVDRSGAAQGLSEVVGGLGVEKLHKLMPDIISTAERSDIAPHVKDGYIMMFIYMPSAFPQDFTPYIGQIINPILKALADENEYVRDTALKAGQRIVNLYAETAVALLLPELEKGLFDDNWRIRFSSVQLLGDLLYRISGVSGKMTTETASEDDNFGTEQSHTAIIRFLGNERRNRVLSGLYMGRSDVSLMVRQAALHVWKVVVTNTPRTLREILPTLFGLLLGCLASTSYDKRQVAARTLGDLVRKLGERVLPEIIPILERGLNSEQADQRQGVCIGLSEIMASTSKEMVLSFVNSLVPTVRKALSDPLPEVREAAAKTFESLHSTVGSRALDDILPSMLEGLSDPDPEVAENTLDGLRQVMTIKSRVVLPYLVPQLTAHPVNTKALSILVSVAGEALTKYLPKILFALLQALSDAQGTANESQELEYCQAVILSVSDEAGIRTIMDTLMASAKSENLSTRKSSASLLSAFCMHTPGDYTQYVPQLLRSLLRLMAESDREILQRSWDSLNAVIKGLDSSQQIAHVSDVRQAVRFAASDSKELELPGFCLPKGIAPLLPVFREAILNGLPEEKENAAQGLGEIISITNAQSLQPSVVHITGPLIRILGDRFNAGVKAAVLETLAILLHKVGVMLKQFLPQLQTTFLKALHDQNRLVRMKAGHALSELVIIHTRADPLFNEIHNSIKSGDDSAIRETMLQALRSVITPAGDKMSDPIKKQICGTLIGLIGHQEDVTRSVAGGCLGALLKYLPSEQVDDILRNHILLEDNDDSHIKHGRTIVLFVALKESVEMVLNNNNEEIILKSLVSYISSDKIQIASNGIRGATYLIEYWMATNKTASPQIVNAFTRAMNHSSNEIKQLVAKSCNHIAKVLNANQISPELLRYLIPMLVNGTKEKNGYVKSNSEIALISILRLRDNEQNFDDVCQILDAGARDSLCEVVSKVLRKAAIQPAGKDEELDDTLLIY
ncbi:eIF-2-alpha kinase activator GCN1 [Lucilia sericata]|uniref:eIF-2-alpha kinase activator GCN1 n=1 Tax=Lucilia sericata TaxID=13632 RepID=UPI0018A84FBC|nr:eIF-2-alpha kinase activator GCN1 [Lucilia sericata]XP_037814627.1 eIF-2-alpha kinase activator GCN1 [Lucilia sericata]